MSLEEEKPTRSVNASVGLIRVGEMLSSQSSSILTKGYTSTSSYNNARDYWTMTTNRTVWSWSISEIDNADYKDVSDMHTIRPVIVIKSDVEIISGTGTFSNPYQI